MKIFMTILSVLLILVGSVWFLQGLNVLGGSRMSGQPQWEFNGVVVVVLGLGLLVFIYWRKKGRPKN